AKKLMQPIGFGPLRGGSLTVRNKQYFTDLAWLEFAWRLEVDGRRVSSGKLAVPADVAPQRSVRVPIDLPERLPAGEAFVTVEARARKRTPWCERGHVVAWEQLPIKSTAAKPAARTGKRQAPQAAPKIEVVGSSFTLTQPGAGLVIRGGDKQPGIEQIDFNGRPVVVASPALNLWRGPTSNDGVKGKPEQWHADWKPLGRWCNAGLDKPTHVDRASSRPEVVKAGKAVLDITDRWACTDREGATREILHRHTYSLDASGVLTVDNECTIDPGLPDLPRLGLIAQLAPGFERLRWFGRGPGESYPDRQRSEPVGLYTCDVNQTYVPYVVPQEHGLRTDVRWFEVTHPGHGITLRVTPASPGNAKRKPSPLHFSATHFTPADLTAAAHTHELRPRDETVLCIDHAHRGLGTASCGPDTHPRHHVLPGTYRWAFTLSVTDAPAKS
ncbi:MAG: beta-galactosidase domain 4-containing protein, partial [Planctomycetota bacterium]